MNKPLNFNAYHPDCPSRLFFENMADKWILFILDTLKSEPQHFNSLKKHISGISPKVLSQKLKMLERNGFIIRKMLDTRPIRIEYSLTLLGSELGQAAFQFRLWAESNMQKVQKAQQHYDAIQAHPITTDTVCS
ncbi:winged helix-turn-helix transcriptional regulator [Acinetobacter sp. WZC-1]|uniref:winged helix-turn-helix transcriptional regulator n=1 Tax=Acinetobacter sp. WZC-1 TaxID=3459034 RepID=UPI00403D8347